MLPDIRAVFGAFVAAIGLLVIAFGAVATLRVAQQSHAGSFQSDLARRGQAVPPQSRPHAMVIETPGPHLAPPPPLPVIEVATLRVGAEVSAVPIVRETAPDAPPLVPAAASETVVLPVAEAPVGGPLAEPAPVQSDAHRAAARAERAERVRKLAAARKAREARLVRQRKIAAARRAAQARARQQRATTSSFNTGFGNQSFGTQSFGNSSFGNTSAPPQGQ